jgi:uncharacterized protein
LHFSFSDNPHCQLSPYYRTIKPRVHNPMNKTLAGLIAAAIGLIAWNAHGQVSLTGTSYNQTFDTVGSGLPSGWDVRTGATATALGTAATFNTTATSWADTTGQFANMASSDGHTGTETSTQQAAFTDRDIGIRQTAGVGDPGGAMDFNFNASSATFSGASTALSLKLQMLSVQSRSTTWSIQYGIGASPSSWSTLGTWSDPGAFGSTSFAFSGTTLSALSGQSNAWIRVVALASSTGSGSRDSIGLDDFTLSYTTAVPEPSTWFAGALTLVGLIASQRRRLVRLLNRP